MVFDVLTRGPAGEPHLTPPHPTQLHPNHQCHWCRVHRLSSVFVMSRVLSDCRAPPNPTCTTETRTELPAPRPMASRPSQRPPQTPRRARGRRPPSPTRPARRASDELGSWFSAARCGAGSDWPGPRPPAPPLCACSALSAQCSCMRRETADIRARSPGSTCAIKDKITDPKTGRGSPKNNAVNSLTAVDVRIRTSLQPNRHRRKVPRF